MRTKIEAAFPNLFNHYVSSEVSSETPQYNCIAWACGIDTERYWPNGLGFGYTWPPGVTNSADLASFKELFESLGYKECVNGDPEQGFLKVVVFTDQQGTPTHAARQQSDGYWTSKLGPYIDLSHTIEGMDNAYYGQATLYMRRPT